MALNAIGVAHRPGRRHRGERQPRATAAVRHGADKTDDAAPAARYTRAAGAPPRFRRFGTCGAVRAGARRAVDADHAARRDSARRDADLGAARDGPRVHARGAVDRLLGRRRAASRFTPTRSCSPSLSNTSPTTSSRSAVTDRRRVPRHAADRVDHHHQDLRHDPRLAGSARSTARSASCSGSRAASSSWSWRSCSSTGWCPTAASPNGSRTPSRWWCCREPGQWLMSLLPDDPESTILKRLKTAERPDDQDQPDTPPGGRSSLGPPRGPLCCWLSRNRTNPCRGPKG